MALVTVLILLLLPLSIARISHHVIPRRRCRRRCWGIDHHVLAAVFQVAIVGVGDQVDHRAVHAKLVRIGRQVADSRTRGRHHDLVTPFPGAVPVPAGVEIVLPLVGHLPETVSKPLHGLARPVVRPGAPAFTVAPRAALPALVRRVARAWAMPTRAVIGAAGNVLVEPRPWGLRLTDFVTRIERTPRRGPCLHTWPCSGGGQSTWAVVGPGRQGCNADAHAQQTNTCPLPDVRLHGSPLDGKTADCASLPRPITPPIKFQP